MKTIVILSHVTFDNSPYCIFVHEHAKALKKLGYNVAVFALLNWFPFISILKKNRRQHYKEKKGIQIIDGITVIYKKRLSFSNILVDSKINLNGISYYWTIKRKIKKIIRDNDILFVDAHMFQIEGYVATLVQKKFGCKTTVTCHGTSLIKATEYKNSNYMISRIMHNVDYAICVSNLLEAKLKTRGFTNTTVIYNGINLYPINEEKENRDITILTVATLIKRKNIDLILKAFEEISKRFKNVKLTIVGEGIEKERLQEFTRELKIEEKVEFVGQKKNDEVHEIMKRSKIFLLPSINEGFGIVYPEAMHNGCITIGTKNEGIDGFIVDGVNGFLVKPELDDIVGKLEYILKNEDKLKDIILQGEKDAKNLTWENNAKSYVELFEERV